MNKIKARLAVISLTAIILTFITESTFAYYTSFGRASNVITMGNIELKIHETTDSGTEFPEEGVYIIPGDIVSKRVNVENVGTNPFYLRMKVVYGIDSETLSSKEAFKLNIDESIWQLHDGWYYYKGVLEVGETTPDLFSHVEIVGSKVDNSYIGRTLSLTVKAHAVQSENNVAPIDAVYTVSGWPEE